MFDQTTPCIGIRQVMGVMNPVFPIRIVVINVFVLVARGLLLKLVCAQSHASLKSGQETEDADAVLRKTNVTQLTK